MFGWEWIVIPAMVAINSVFAAYEIAIASVSPTRLRTLAHDNRRGARAALWMKENMEASLAAVQLGITFVGAIAAATGGAGATETISPYFEGLGLSSAWAEFFAIATVVVPLSFLTILVGELFPKVFALRNKEWVCLQLSTAMRWFCRLVWPLVWLFESVVTGMMTWGEARWKTGLAGQDKSESLELQELRAVAALARASRLIGGREENIIIQAGQLSSRPIREIMLPAEDIVMLVLTNTMAESLIAAHMDMHTRFPVAQQAGDPQSITGYVNFKDIVAQLKLSPHEPSLRNILRSIPNLSDDAPISASLGRLIREHTHIALVRDRMHKVIGMITLEDILEELVGDIQDEFDRLPVHVVKSGSAWVVGGGISLDRLNLVAGIDLGFPPGEVRTLNDYITTRLGRAVLGGDVIEQNGIRILVRKVRRKKVLEAQVSPNAIKPP